MEPRYTEAASASTGGVTTAYLLPSIPQNSGGLRSRGAGPPPPRLPQSHSSGFSSSASEQGAPRRPAQQRQGYGVAAHEESEAARRRAKVADIERRVRQAAQRDALAQQAREQMRRIRLAQQEHRREEASVRRQRQRAQAGGALGGPWRTLRGPRRASMGFEDEERQARRRRSAGSGRYPAADDSSSASSSSSADDIMGCDAWEQRDDDDGVSWTQDVKDLTKAATAKLGGIATGAKARAADGLKRSSVVAAQAGRIASGALASAAVAATIATGAAGAAAGGVVVGAAFAAGKAAKLASRKAQRRVARMQAEVAARTRLLRQMYPKYFDVEGAASRLNQFQSALACGAQAVEIPQGKMVSIPFNVKAGSEAVWEWVPLELDVGFRVSLRTMADGGAVELAIVPLARHSAAGSVESDGGGGGGDGVVRGSWSAGIEGVSGQLVLVWDNTYSWFTSKHVAFRVDVLSPEQRRAPPPRRHARSAAARAGAAACRGATEGDREGERAAAAEAQAAEDAAAAADDAEDADAARDDDDVEQSGAQHGGILHHALASGASAMMIETIIGADARCARARDDQRRLPLHVALTRPVAEIAIIDAICAAYPRALRKRVQEVARAPTTAGGGGATDGSAAAAPCPSVGMLPYEVALQNRASQAVLRTLLRRAQELETADNERKERRFQRRKRAELAAQAEAEAEAEVLAARAEVVAVAAEAAALEADAAEGKGGVGAKEPPVAPAATRAPAPAPATVAPAALLPAASSASIAPTPAASSHAAKVRVAYRSPAGRRASGVLTIARGTGALALFRGDTVDAGALEGAYPLLSGQGCTVSGDAQVVLPTEDGTVALTFESAGAAEMWAQRIGIVVADGAASFASLSTSAPHSPPGAVPAAAPRVAQSRLPAEDDYSTDGFEALFAAADEILDYSTDA